MNSLIIRLRLGYIVILSILISGCDQLSTQTEQPLNTVHQPENGTVQDTIQEPVSLSLFKGQTEAEVRELLGSPSGFMSISNRTMLLYSGIALNFENGKLTAPAPDILSQIEAKKNAPPPTPPKSDAKSKTAGTKILNKISSITSAKEVVLNDAKGNKIDHSRLVTKGKITVVDFYATWCGPCQQLAPILDKIVSGQGDVVLRKVDIGDWGSAIATQYNVNSVPNIRVFDKQGRLIAQPTSNPDQIIKNIEKARKSK